MQTRSTFLSRAFAFCARQQVSKSELGRLAVRDPAFLRQVEKGHPVTLGRIERAEAFMVAVEADPGHLTEARRKARMSQFSEKRRQVAGGGGA